MRTSSYQYFKVCLIILSPALLLGKLELSRLSILSKARIREAVVVGCCQSAYKACVTGAERLSPRKGDPLRPMEGRPSLHGSCLLTVNPLQLPFVWLAQSQKNQGRWFSDAGLMCPAQPWDEARPENQHCKWAGLGHMAWSTATKQNEEESHVLTENDVYGVPLKKASCSS